MEYKIIDYDGLTKDMLQDVLNQLYEKENWMPLFPISDTTWMVLSRATPQTHWFTVNQQQAQIPWGTPISNAG